MRYATCRQCPDRMNNPSDRNLLTPSWLHNTNIFLCMLGILTAASLPTVLFFLGGEWVTRKTAIIAYLGTVAVLFIFFFLMILAEEWLKKRSGAPDDTLPSAYVTFVIPVNCLLIALTVNFEFP